ncbi:helix-turn-helix transcriptional regulator [Microbacterium oxydans]|uniref:helix-turn-helix transcriptional regulator n=1 Tax=Microbacterium oxydans TaxID=82380 RepID=UPI000734E42B|nr:helix-turn-helix transcriptional regulator [Microbacterium oxydans]
MMQSLRRIAASISPYRARAKLLAQENSEMRANLVRIRREAGLTQADVAELLGVTQQAVNKIERYDADLKLSTLERYSNAVGALVFHRVEADNGRSVRMVTEATWVSGRATLPHRIDVRRPSRVTDGWHDARVRIPAEIVATS